MKMKKTAIILVAVMVIMLLAGCGAKNAAVGTWTDDGELVTFTFDNDGTGELNVYVAMFNSSTKNELEYTCERNTIKWKFAGSDEDYQISEIKDGSFEYASMTLKKK